MKSSDADLLFTWILTQVLSSKSPVSNKLYFLPEDDLVILTLLLTGQNERERLKYFCENYQTYLMEKSSFSLFG